MIQKPLDCDSKSLVAININTNLLKLGLLKKNLYRDVKK